MFHFCRAIIYLPVKIFYPTKFYGKKKIPKGACIIASNHRSNMDSVLLAVNTFEKKYYLAKKELFKGIAGPFIKSLGGLKIDRQANDLSAIKNGLKVLKKGKKLVVFPEGTRVNNENDQMGEVKQGLAMFAIKGKVPIVPIYIAKKPKIFRRNKVFIGDPFELDQFYDKKLDKDAFTSATQIIATKFEELKNIATNSLTKKK